jgi:hypothetical protein
MLPKTFEHFITEQWGMSLLTVRTLYKHVNVILQYEIRSDPQV